MSRFTVEISGNPVTLVVMPATPGISSVDFTTFDGVGVVLRPFVGSAQAQQWHGGDMWSGTARVPPLAQADADNWIAFLEELRGKANAFQMGDPAQPAPRGSMAGSPQVDNTLNNGNPAGSPLLGTKGWTPNSAGVLLVGDYIQIGFRLYRVLEDVNADANGQAVIPLWPSLREAPYNDGTTAKWINATGALAMTGSDPLGNDVWGAQWESFTAPTLPSDAVIQGIYPVVQLSYTKDRAFAYAFWGYISDPGALEPGGESFGDFSASFSSQEIYPSTSIGSLLSILDGISILLQLQASEPQTDMLDAMAVTGVGFAVYYASATPSTDTLLPAPFSVPSGQGLSWSLPLWFLTGTFLPDATNGSASGMPALDNGAFHPDPVGMWRLADNKRDYTTDIRKVTPLTFTFQEYR